MNKQHSVVSCNISLSLSVSLSQTQWVALNSGIKVSVDKSGRKSERTKERFIKVLSWRGTNKGRITSMRNLCSCVLPLQKRGVVLDEKVASGTRD